MEVCRDAEPNLVAYLGSLGIEAEALEAVVGGPFSPDLPDPKSFAAELEMGCSGEFFFQSSFGEMAHIVAAWNPTTTHAVLGALIRGDLAGDLPEVERDLIVDFDQLQRARLYPAGDDVFWSGVDRWSTVWALRPVAAIAGDDPLEGLGAWHRATTTAESPTLVVGTSSGWGGGVTTIVVTRSGELISLTDERGFPATFDNAWKVVDLSADELQEAGALAMATGVTSGDAWHLDDSFIDADSLWFQYRADDVTYYGLVYAPRLGEETPARQSIIDLSLYLEELADATEGSRWVPETVIVHVDEQDPSEDGEVVPWLGSFDLSAAAERGCVLLDGDDAAGYVDDVSLISDHLLGRDRAVFEYEGATYSVTASGVLPGDPERLIDLVPGCDKRGWISADPGLLVWLWDARGIDWYELEVTAECSRCTDFTLDGSTAVAVPGWGEFRSIVDLWALAAREDLDLIELTTDGYVGVPNTIEVLDPQSGERLRLSTVSFRSDEGRLSFERHEVAGTSMSIDGFDQWRVEGY